MTHRHSDEFDLPEYHRNFREEEFDLYLTVKMGYINEDGELTSETDTLSVKHVSAYGEPDVEDIEQEHGAFIAARLERLLDGLKLLSWSIQDIEISDRRAL